VRAATRCSPLDGGNMNRAFPGAADGGPTAMIADWLQTVILPLCDGAIDIHAGGRVTNYAPLSMINGGEGALYEENLALARAFGAPLLWQLGALNDARSVNGAAQMAKVPMMACELGGRGDVEPTMIQIAHDGIKNVMRYLGMLPDGVALILSDPRRVHSVDRANSHLAPHSGLFDPLLEVGVDVKQGDLGGWVRDPFDLSRPPSEIRFARSGHLAIRGTRGLVGPDDLLFGLVTDMV
ncbi:MAG: succinylglutamate desuccinylase/aspartoacylase family protein, partial [Alphaproteobacteria bacterium]|nr:succinylglutamate desuccinylase/aspartoacylase family protein [Alphaproteobacteria bacterium]